MLNKNNKNVGLEVGGDIGFSVTPEVVIEQKKGKFNILVEMVERLAKNFDNEEVRNVLDELRQQQDILDVEKTLTIKKILEVLKINSIRKTLEMPHTKNIEDDFLKVDQILDEMIQELYRGEQLNNLGERILSEYGEDAKEKDGLSSYRSVKEIAKEHGILFVHSFWQEKENSSTGPHSVVDATANWQTKLKIILALDPAISTSSLREGNPKEKTYFLNSVGVILKNGEVRSATSGGEVTTSVREGEKSGHTPDQKELKEALVDQRGTGSNEVVVAAPEVAGIIISDDSDLYSNNNLIGNLDLARQISALSLSLGKMPIYIRKSGDGADGKFYKAVFDPDTGGLRAGQLVTAEEVVNNQFELSEERKRSLQEEIFEDCPFKLDLPEKYFIDEHRFGSKNYFAIANNDIICTSRSFSPEFGTAPTAIEHIDQVRATAKTRKDFLLDSEKEGNDSPYIQQTSQLLKEIAWYLYGFAEAAKTAGDLASYDAATSAAVDIFPKDEYDRVIQERRGKNGRFKMTAEDLKTVRSS